jgi:hypothetical protein
MHEQEAPLIQLGPNSTYGTAIYGRITLKNNTLRARLIAVVGASKQDVVPRNYRAKPKTFLDRLLGIDRIQFTPAASATNTWDFSQAVKSQIPRQKSPIQMISMYLKNLSKVKTMYAKQLPLFSRNNTEQEQTDELNTKTARSTRINQATSKKTRLFAHNERIIIGTRCEQSHRLRKNRGTYSQRRASSRTEQSSLFVNC